jgi:hypothetical protein
MLLFSIISSADFFNKHPTNLSEVETAQFNAFPSSFAERVGLEATLNGFNGFALEAITL